MSILQRNEGEHVKNILFEKRINLEKRVKSFSIHSKTEDKQCKTRIAKSFTYAVDRAREAKPTSKPPLIFIHKSFDTKERTEGFSFHVKGYFFVKHNRQLMKVRFNHTLDIEIQWKIKDFSPKKSASLT